MIGPIVCGRVFNRIPTARRDAASFDAEIGVNSMPLFRCSIRGENFPGELIGRTAALGFHATRFVHAESAVQAESMVVAALRNDSELTVSSEPVVKNAKVYFDKIEEVPADTPTEPNKGFAFFSMDN